MDFLLQSLSRASPYFLGFQKGFSNTGRRWIMQRSLFHWSPWLQSLLCHHPLARVLSCLGGRGRGFRVSESPFANSLFLKSPYCEAPSPYNAHRESESDAWWFIVFGLKKPFRRGEYYKCSSIHSNKVMQYKTPWTPSRDPNILTERDPNILTVSIHTHKYTSPLRTSFYTFIHTHSYNLRTH